MSWWNYSWLERKKVVIYGINNTPQTNFNVLVKITYESEMNANFSDIRFVDSDDNTELTHYLVYKVDSNVAYYWVRIPNLNKNNYTFWAYYHNSSASSAAVSESTFFSTPYDSFDDQSFDTDKWTFRTPHDFTFGDDLFCVEERASPNNDLHLTYCNANFSLQNGASVTANYDNKFNENFCFYYNYKVDLHWNGSNWDSSWYKRIPLLALYSGELKSGINDEYWTADGVYLQVTEGNHADHLFNISYYDSSISDYKYWDESSSSWTTSPTDYDVGTTLCRIKMYGIGDYFRVKVYNSSDVLKMDTGWTSTANLSKKVNGDTRLIIASAYNNYIGLSTNYNSIYGKEIYISNDSNNNAKTSVEENFGYDDSTGNLKIKILTPNGKKEVVNDLIYASFTRELSSIGAFELAVPSNSFTFNKYVSYEKQNSSGNEQGLIYFYKGNNLEFKGKIMSIDNDSNGWTILRGRSTMSFLTEVLSNDNRSEESAETRTTYFLSKVDKINPGALNFPSGNVKAKYYRGVSYYDAIHSLVVYDKNSEYYLLFNDDGNDYFEVRELAGRQDSIRTFMIGKDVNSIKKIEDKSNLITSIKVEGAINGATGERYSYTYPPSGTSASITKYGKIEPPEPYIDPSLTSDDACQVVAENIVNQFQEPIEYIICDGIVDTNFIFNMGDVITIRDDLNNINDDLRIVGYTRTIDSNNNEKLILKTIKYEKKYSQFNSNFIRNITFKTNHDGYNLLSDPSKWQSGYAFGASTSSSGESVAMNTDWSGTGGANDSGYLLQNQSINANIFALIINVQILGHLNTNEYVELRVRMHKTGETDVYFPNTDGWKFYNNIEGSGGSGFDMTANFFIPGNWNGWQYDIETRSGTGSWNAIFAYQVYGIPLNAWYVGHEGQSI